MNLINIEQTTIGGDLIETVNARELHEFLESKQDFSTWIKNRIEQYGFVEGQDFTLHKFVERRATRIDYHITLDMAKELSMVERNEKGKQARQYFIKCEKELRGVQKTPELPIEKAASHFLSFNLSSRNSTSKRPLCSFGRLGVEFREERLKELNIDDIRVTAGIGSQETIVHNTYHRNVNIDELKPSLIELATPLLSTEPYDEVQDDNPPMYSHWVLNTATGDELVVDTTDSFYDRWGSSLEGFKAAALLARYADVLGSVAGEAGFYPVVMDS